MSFSNVGPSVPPKGAAASGGDVHVSLAVDWKPMLDAVGTLSATVGALSAKPVVVELDWKVLGDRLLTLENAVVEAGEMMTEQLGEIAEAVRRIEPAFTFAPQVQPSEVRVEVMPAAELPPSVMVSAVPGASHVKADLTLPAWSKPLLYAGLLVFLCQAVLIGWISYMVFEAAELTKAFF